MWPPSRVRSNSPWPFTARSNCTPSATSSAMRAGPSLTIVRTASSLQSPRAGISVSAHAGRTSPPRHHARNAALGPGGVRVARRRFVSSATRPCFAAFNAKLNPAMPLPTTAKSKVMIAQTRFRIHRDCRFRKFRTFARSAMRAIANSAISINDSRRLRAGQWLVDFRDLRANRRPMAEARWEWASR